MSFWNFLGEFALFNMICDLLSGKTRSQHQSFPPFRDYTRDYTDAEYETRIEELQQEIDHSKMKIAEYQRIIDSERAYRIDDADVDALQDNLDDLQDDLDDLQDDLDDLYDDLNDIDIECDEDW